MAEVDPSLAFAAPARSREQPSGHEPLLGGSLRQQAVWVDEAVCIGCRYCAHVATNTFLVEPVWGRSRAIRQDGDSTETIQEAIDTCPVDCIHWVPYEDVPQLDERLRSASDQELWTAEAWYTLNAIPEAERPAAIAAAVSG